MRKFFIVLLIVAATILATITWLVLSHGFPFVLMDVDDSGFVSLSELVNSIELWHRPATGREGVCTEVFRLKDGSAVKVVCEKN